MRRGELVGLRWTDVDLEAGRLTVRRAVVTVRYEMIESEPKTEKSRRPIALDPQTVKILREWRVRQLEERLLCGGGWIDTDDVFTRPDGSGLHPDRVSKLFDAAVNNAGVPRLRLHDVRHTWATMALRAGVHPKIVSERLGHSSIQITLDIYSHITEEQDREAAIRVADLMRR
jgi:integrase